MASIRLQFGKTIRRLRTRRGFSQEAFAHVLRLHRTYIGAVERGEINVSLDNIARIADGLGVSISRLFAEAESERT